MNVEIKPIVVGDKEYYTVVQCATIVGLSPQGIYHRINKGKGINKIHSETVLNQLLISSSEVNRLVLQKEQSMQEGDKEEDSE